jgi:uncharacterized coiled-coil protein SlyX
MTTTAFVYKWTHVPTGRWYIGSRTKQGCNPDDGYICSSKTIKPLITENLAEWHREILAVGEPAAMLELETRYLVSLDAKNDPMSYNQHNSDGKFSTAGKEPWNKGRGKPIGKPSWNAGLTKADHPGLAKMAKSKLGSIPYNKGQTMSEEQRLKMIEIHNNRSEETCKKISEALTGRTQTEEANAKRSAALKGRVSPRKGKTYPKQKGPKPLL